MMSGQYYQRVFSCVIFYYQVPAIVNNQFMCVLQYQFKSPTSKLTHDLRFQVQQISRPDFQSHPIMSSIVSGFPHSQLRTIE
jgi:hypothetical protein